MTDYECVANGDKLFDTESRQWNEYLEVTLPRNEALAWCEKIRNFLKEDPSALVTLRINPNPMGVPAIELDVSSKHNWIAEAAVECER